MEGDKYNPFNFISNRKSSKEPEDFELATFDPYMTQTCVSMIKGCEILANSFNNVKFFRLPKDIQCKSFLFLNGKNTYFSWKKAKKSTIDSNKELIDKIVTLYNYSYSDANSFLLAGLIDINKTEELYDRVYNPETIKFKDVKKKTKKEFSSVDSTDSVLQLE